MLIPPDLPAAAKERSKFKDSQLADGLPSGITTLAIDPTEQPNWPFVFEIMQQCIAPVSPSIRSQVMPMMPKAPSVEFEFQMDLFSANADQHVRKSRSDPENLVDPDSAVCPGDYAQHFLLVRGLSPQDGDVIWPKFESAHLVSYRFKFTAVAKTDESALSESRPTQHRVQGRNRDGTVARLLR
jgi:hypothetical protein